MQWQEEAPWYREIADGFCWLCYCENSHCAAYRQLVVINRGYGRFNYKDLLELRCPACRSECLSVRNCGFVKTQWTIRG